MTSIDKRALLAVLTNNLAEELSRARAQALGAAAGATHTENRPEGIKDMRSTEASYVARGQAERVAKLEAALVLLSHMELRALSADDAVEMSALVELEHGTVRGRYFVAPAAGGERIEFEGASILTLTPTSPLGRAVIGRRVGDDLEVESPQGTRSYRVTALG